MEIAVDHRRPSPSLAPAAPAPRSRTERSALQDVLAELGERVKPISLAREQTLALADPFDQLLPEGLVRGRVVSCQGNAARSVAFGLVRAALADGAWMAVVDVSTFGTDSAAEFGVPLERVVRIETDVRSSGRWIDVMAAAVDGFDLVLTRVPPELHDRRPAAVRTLLSRLRRTGAVIVTLGASGALGADVELMTQRTIWSGLGDGSGHLDRRIVHVQAGGRRIAARRSCAIEMSGVGTRVSVGAVADRDPQAELLAEMADAVQVHDLDDVGDRRLVG